MKSASWLLVAPLSVVALLISAMAMAGGGHNSTSPALGTVQLASILCNVSSGSSPQGYVRNNSLNGPVAAAQLRRSGLCQSLAARHSSQNYKGKHKAIGRHYGREASRTHGHSTVAVNSVQRNTDSRDSFKQEAWFMADGGKQRRVTKHQARKQGWTGPAAMQAAHQSRLAANPPTPAIPTNEPLMAQLHSSDSPPNTARIPQPVSQLSRAQASLVTDCPECNAVETGTLEAAGQAPVPFKMVRNHGVIAIPQFEPGSNSALATQDTEPKIRVKKFRMVDGVMQPDTRFSDDGMEDFSVPLPAGDRVTAFTLDKDRLVVLSRPEADQGLSRVTLINIQESDDSDLIDGGVSSGLWVKGELFRYHDNALYTLSRDEQKLFIYPDLASDSSQSLSAVRVVDLAAIGLADGELVSALADSERCHVAVRRSDPESDGQRIHLYQMDDAGTLTLETVITGVGDQDDAWLHFKEGEPALLKVPAGGAGTHNLVFPDSANGELASHEPGENMGKRGAIDEGSGSADEASYRSRKKRQSLPCDTHGSYLIPYIGCRVEGQIDCNCIVHPSPKRCIRYTCETGTASCTCYEAWTWRASESQPAPCGYLGTADCVSYHSPSSDSHCYGTVTNYFHPDNEAICLRNGTAGSAPTETGCFLNSQKSTGPAAIVVAVSTGLGTACLTAGFMGCEGKKRSGHHDDPMKPNDDPAHL